MVGRILQTYLRKRSGPTESFQAFVARHDIAYVRGQAYLAPHPTELMLRNHV